MTERTNHTLAVKTTKVEILSSEERLPIKVKEDVFLVRGAKRGAICDTNAGNVYSINEFAVKVIAGQQDDPEYQAQLQQMGLTNGERPVPQEVKRAEPKLNFVWFEIISDDCNESCAHCYAESMPPSHRKALGIENGDNPQILDPRPKLKVEEWQRLIREAFDLGCRQCQFIGGEPFVYHDGGKRVIDLAAYAKEVGFEFIEIFTNATLLNTGTIQRIKELGVHMAVSLYSSVPDVHNSITHLPRSHQMTTNNLKRLKEAEVPTRVESVLMHANQHTVAQTMIFIDELGFEPHNPDVLRPKGRGDNPEIQPDDEYLVRYGLMLGPNFSAPKRVFERYSSSHGCLAGKITITDRGDILPCIFSRDQVTGNVVKAGSLKAVLEKDPINDIWTTTKDDVLVCQDCEYRYVCFDCRPLSQGANGGREYQRAPYPRCTYNPYEGEWGGGTWKLDENGNPYYDETLKPIIEKVRSDGNLGAQTKGH